MGLIVHTWEAGCGVGGDACPAVVAGLGLGCAAEEEVDVRFGEAVVLAVVLGVVSGRLVTARLEGRIRWYRILRQ